MLRYKNVGSVLSQSWEVGPHRAEFDGSILRVYLDGEVTVPQAAKLMEILFAIDAAQDHIGLLILTNGKLGISAEARRFLVKSSRATRPAVPTAIIGTEALIRALLTLLLNAARLTLRKEVPAAFFATEPEALPWLLAQIEHRARALALARPKPPAA
jgi:hypothetical protein